MRRPAKSFLLTLEPNLDRLALGRFHCRRSFFEHRHEEFDFLRRERMADVCAAEVAGRWPLGINDQAALRIGEREIWQARVLAAELFENTIAAGIFEILFSVALLYDEMDRHELFFQDRSGFLTLG